MVLSVPRDVNQIDGNTVTRLKRPVGTRITTVRGGEGTPQNQNNPSSSKLDYSKETPQGGQRYFNVRQVTAAQSTQFKSGSHAPQSFDPVDVNVADDEITVVEHAFVLGQIVQRILP